MDKDTSIRNQKAFIRMSAVLDLQKRYLTVSNQYAERKAQGGTSAENFLIQKRIFEQVIDMLELPIEKV